MRKIILASAFALLVVIGFVVYIGKSDDNHINKIVGTVMFIDKQHGSGYIVLEQPSSDSFISIKELAEDVHEHDKVEFLLSQAGEALNVRVKR